MYSSNLIGFILAVVSSAFIGSSFIIKKKGLRRAGINGPRAGTLLAQLLLFLQFYFCFFNYTVLNAFTNANH